MLTLRPVVLLARCAKRLSCGRLSIVDLLLLGIAIALGLPSLALPFGHDQGLYFYVGREWLHGAIPYRDVFDHKTPGIYVIHLVAIAIFGEHTWAIRIADLACVLTLGAIVARLVTARKKPLAPGTLGLGTFVASLLHYGLFDYWNTAQSELWYTTLGIGAVTAATRVQSRRVAAAGTGFLTALAMIMKPPSVWYATLAFVLLFARLLRERGEANSTQTRLYATLKDLGLYALAVGVPSGLTLGYFVAHDALTDMIDIVVGANGYYVSHEKGVQTLADVTIRLEHAWRTWFPLAGLVLVTPIAAIAVGLYSRSAHLLKRYGLGTALLIAAFGAIAMQQKFYELHWLTIIGPSTYLLLAFAEDIAEWARNYVARAIALPAFASMLCIAYGFSPSSSPIWAQTKTVLQLTAGQISREEFARRFFVAPLYFYEADVEATSAFIKSIAKPSDTLCSRGFNPEIYVLTGLRYQGRFFWTNFLMDPRRAYRRDDYLREDRSALERSLPRFVVAVKKEEGRGNIESSEYYFPLGYRIIREFGTMQVLELSQSEGSP